MVNFLVIVECGLIMMLTESRGKADSHKLIRQRHAGSEGQYSMFSILAGSGVVDVYGRSGVQNNKTMVVCHMPRPYIIIALSFSCHMIGESRA